jgi:hypothetical protein
MKHGSEQGSEGFPVGRDPRSMGRAELEALGHEPMTPMEALRAHCLDCAGSASEVRLCMALRCPSWPFRMGSSPWRPKLSDEQLAAKRAQGHALADRMRRSVKNTGVDRPFDAGTGRPATTLPAAPSPSKTPDKILGEIAANGLAPGRLRRRS